MKIGFTGTREGMTDAQLSTVENLFKIFVVSEFHHGDCCGADAEAHEMAQELGAKVHAHPPLNEAMRAFMKADVVHPARDYLPRNRDVVDATFLLIGASMSAAPETFGGTWYTIDYAIKTGRRTIVVWPDGSIRTFNWWSL
jgi:hypothetical protein